MISLKSVFNEEFLNYCQNDINDILNETIDILPNLEVWQLNKSVIFDDNKKILSKPILDENRKVLGYNINIDAFLDTLYHYKLVLKENSISLFKRYTVDNEFIEEIYKCELKDKIKIRTFSYKDGNREMVYNDYYDKSNILRHDEEEISIRDKVRYIKNKHYK